MLRSTFWFTEFGVGRIQVLSRIQSFRLTQPRSPATPREEPKYSRFPALPVTVPDGRGARTIADSSYLALVTDQHLRTVIIVGMPNLGMPDWRSHRKPLTDADVGDLVAWLAAQRRTIVSAIESVRCFR